MLVINLFAKDRCRMALFDEPEKIWPEVTAVSSSLLFPGQREGLAGAGACPHFTVCGPAGKAQRQVPSPDAREKMHSAHPGKFIGHDGLDVSLVNGSIGYLPGFAEVPQPLGGVLVMLVVVGQGIFLPSPSGAGFSEGAG